MLKNDLSTPKHGGSEGGAAVETEATQAAMDQKNHSFDEPVIVIGGGPAGIRVTQELARRKIPVTIFNAERWRPYNRVKLTPLLAGDVQVGQVYQQPNFAADSTVKQYSAHSIVDIDPASKTVTGHLGRGYNYSKLIIATGSRAHIPPIPGIERDGVYKFRNFDDTEQLVARTFSSRRTVVIGGGLLGLEAARGMANRGVETWVIEHEPVLMARQLDKAGGDLLAAKIRALGLGVRVGQAVKEIKGNGRVEAIVLGDGEEIACDTVIVCTGIRPNMEMARDAGLAVGRGITVRETLQTTNPDIYAIGECAECDGHIYGLVGPGLEQAALAAAHIAGEEVSYAGSLPTTKLKVVGTDVFSMGDVEQLDQRSDVETALYENAQEGIYRRIVMRRGRLVGALAIGEWPEINVLQKAIKDQHHIWPWHIRRFRKTGFVKSPQEPASVIEWPAAATVCNCTGVSRGQIGEAIQQGAVTFEAVQRETSASTVCGTCKPMIYELLEGKPAYEPVKLFRPVAILSAIAFLIALITFFSPPWPYTQSMTEKLQLDQLWRDGYWKQVSGFTLLGLSVLAALLSLRKKIKWGFLGEYSFWRILHVSAGVLALLVLFLHTGFHLGSNLNFWLMMSFLSLAFVGAVAGGIKAFEHVLQRKGVRAGSGPPAALPIWVHIILFWPLPVLLALHIFTVYYY